MWPREHITNAQLPCQTGGVIVRDSLIYADYKHPVTAAYQPGHMALSMTRATLMYAIHSLIDRTFIKARLSGRH